MLLNAVKDVASSLCNLIDSAKNSSGKTPGEAGSDDLKNAAKVMQSLIELSLTQSLVDT